MFRTFLVIQSLPADRGGHGSVPALRGAHML